MSAQDPTKLPARRWTVGRWIPLEAQDDCDRLIEEWRATGDDDVLAAAWLAVEPWAVGAAEDAWWKAKWRVGRIVEPGDLLSLAKVVFLERLIKRWDTKRGSFLNYALVSFRIEFFKWNRREMRRKSSGLEDSPPEIWEPVERPGSEEARIQIEVAFQRIEHKDPEKGRWARWCTEHLHVPLRELARINAGRRGYSRSALNLRMQAAQESLREEIGE